MKSQNLSLKLIFIGIYIISLLLLLEIVVRIFFWFDIGIEPRGAICKYYPHLCQVVNTTHDKDNFDILLLGGSTIAGFWENKGFEKFLGESLTSQTGRRIRIYNLANSGHSSKDSYIKYKALINRKFDLVIIYDGVNEVRANNCPSHVFKQDYSHYYWYEDLNLIDLHQEMKFLVSPFMIHKLTLRIFNWLNHIEYVQRELPKKEWLEYGSEIKTRIPFKDNLEKILNIARIKNEKVLLMSFAYYLPHDYSYDKFIEQKLDYSYMNYSSPVELWGKPSNVIKGIDVHNEVIKELIKEHKEVLFVDQASLMPKGHQYFRDVCHFTPLGFKQFADNILQVIKNTVSLNHD